MSIAKVQSEQILEKIIKDMLISGVNPTSDEIQLAFDEFTADIVLGEPQFEADDYKVVRKEQSSASKFNRQNKSIEADLLVGYKAMLEITDQAVLNFSRWNVKAEGLESRLIELENRIDNLLLITQDTSGLFDAVGDHFTDTGLVDLSLSDGVFVDLENDVVKLSSKDSDAVSRVFLEDLQREDVTFTVLSPEGRPVPSSVVNTSPHYAFALQDRYWKTDVYLTVGTPSLIGELSVRLGELKTISKITFHLHSSQSNSSINVTPLYSSDGINYFEVPSELSTRPVTSYGEFVFPEIEATHLKIIFEKRGHDLIIDSLYLYEFGAKEIGLFKEAFSSDPDEVATLISKPLSILDDKEELREFSKATLEVCEEKPEGTSIKYFVAAGNTSGFTPEWKAISPLNTADTAHPSIVEFAITPAYEWEGLTTSYNRTGVVTPSTGVNTVNPNPAYSIIQRNTLTEELETVTATSASRRYIFQRSNQRILSSQVHADLDLTHVEVALWRNVGTKGQVASAVTRGIQKGWEYSEPYYDTVVLVSNASGMTLDVGDKPMYIDNVAYTGIVPASVLSQGTHKIRVHKDNWKPVATGLTSLVDLRGQDILYPYNQKLLVEGYEYDSSWGIASEQVYVGMDRFAGLIAKEISLFEMLNTVAEKDLTRFAIDKDIPGVSTLTTSGTAPLSQVFLLNVDESHADFSAEEFLLELKLADSKFKYLKFKAELQTEDAQLTPVLDAYRIKLG